MTNHTSGPPRPRVRKIWKWVGCFIVLCCVGVGLAIWQNEQTTSSDTDTQPAIILTPPSELTTPPSLPASELSVVESTVEKTTKPTIENIIPLKAEPTRLDIPDANISVAVSLHPLTNSERQARYLKPPNDPTGYWTDLFDMPGRDATDLTYISGHGCEGLPICSQIDWPFNRLSDPALVKRGTAVFVTTKNGKVCYSVDRDIATYQKTSLKDQVEVFGKVEQPERLVLVSCYTGAIHDRNVVAVATRIPCAS